ncbi:MAG: hypothetical protein KGK44_11575 [Gammaproteobacteria bacterium]|nr:hypothetical protein [Gammaproteobacteria bacterium]
MITSRLKSILTCVGLLAALLASTPVFASYMVPPANIGRGVVQSIDYAGNTVTVNGHVYRISAKAAYTGSNVNNLGGLQEGMRIQFVADGPVTSSHSHITSITVLPAASK